MRFRGCAFRELFTREGEGEVIHTLLEDLI